MYSKSTKTYHNVKCIFSLMKFFVMSEGQQDFLSCFSDEAPLKMDFLKCFHLLTRFLFSSSVTSVTLFLTVFHQHRLWCCKACRVAPEHHVILRGGGGGGGVLKEFAGLRTSSLQNQATQGRSCTTELIIWTIWIVSSCNAVRLMWRLF